MKIGIGLRLFVFVSWLVFALCVGQGWHFFVVSFILLGCNFFCLFSFSFILLYIFDFIFYFPSSFLCICLIYFLLYFFFLFVS